MANLNNWTQYNELKSVAPKTKPAIDENTTLIAKPALVIALKSRYMDVREKVLNVFGIKLARRYK